MFTVSLLLVAGWQGSARAGPLEGPWALARGRLWLKTTFLFLETNERFAATPGFDLETGVPFDAGDRVPYFFGGETTVSAVYVQAAYGLIPNLEIMLEVPFSGSSFIDRVDPNRPSTNGLGDLRFGLKLQLLSEPLAAGVTLGAKAPTGASQGFGDAEVVPIGEGQWDLEAGASLGKSFHPFAGYGFVSGGYRLRTENAATAFVPGDEWLARVETGVGFFSRRLWGKARLDWLRGEPIESAGIELDQHRELLAVSPSVFFRFSGGFDLEGGVEVPISGRDYPAGETYFVSLAYTL